MLKKKRKYESRVTHSTSLRAGSPLRKQGHESRERVGSALILTVVLTSLLGIVGVLFLMVSRVNKIATSAISENRELNFAVETIIARISEELVLDVPGVAGQEYYDYPGPQDKWLACLEPFDIDPDPSVIDPCWLQISDIYNKFNPESRIRSGSGLWDQGLKPSIVPDYQDARIMAEGLWADADGDGVADSRWVIIPGMSSSKGKPIFASVRVIDNGGMLNVNTAFKFDPSGSRETIDGSSQMQVNLEALARGEDLISGINVARGLSAIPTNMELIGYERAVIWTIEDPCVAYLPFDISDELLLRNRYMVDQDDTITRIKAVWPGTFDRKSAFGKNFPYKPGDNVSAWFEKTSNGDSSYYIPRHLSTTYNMDRIIDPNGGKMANVNTDDVWKLHETIYSGLYDANFVGTSASAVAAQIAVNLIDFRDNDDNVTAFVPPPGDTVYYGFECPCIYISELAYNFVPSRGEGDPNHTSYAVELYKPYFGDSSPINWQLVVGGTSITIDSWTGGKQFYVIRHEDPVAPLNVDSSAIVKDSSLLVFGANTEISLQRYVVETKEYITVDSAWVPNWLVSGEGSRSFQRDISLHKCIRRLWATYEESPTLGLNNNFEDVDPKQIQAHPYLDPRIYQNNGFKNIGEIGMILRKSVYSQSSNPIGPTDTEDTVRLNLADPVFQQILNYLTVIDPAIYGGGADETRIKGRINVNTAPWFVLAQLPWMQPTIAQAIVAYRDTSAGGFTNISELVQVAGMDFYAAEPADLTTFPDLTPSDGAVDDFEERDVIFSRISNLVTVRSDVFTAYILVRIGIDGPQKRVIAILDRSNLDVHRDSSDGKVRVVALHPVPDPR